MRPTLNENQQLDYARALFPQKEFGLILFILDSLEESTRSEILDTWREDFTEQIHMMRAVGRIREHIRALATQVEVKVDI